mgnify:CR=1 FL=1
MRVLFYAFAIQAICMLASCNSCGSDSTEETATNDSTEIDFSSEALADIVEYQRQKGGGTEYNPWEGYGLKEMIDFAAEEADETEYDDDEYREDPDAAMQFEEGTDDYDNGEPMVYYLGHDVNFNSKKADVSAFTKKSDNAVGVVDRFDKGGSKIDIIMFSKNMYDDFLLKMSDTERYVKQTDNTFLALGDSLETNVVLEFDGKKNDGYLLSIYSK